jgi:hypothetical protein
MNPAFVTLEIIVGYVVCVLVALLGVAVLWKIANGSIDLSALISESTGSASMSRFQLLIFTFVVALSFFFVTVGNVKVAQARQTGLAAAASGGTTSPTRTPGVPELPDIPGGVLAVLGISASSYLVSKGIQSGKDTEMERLQTSAGPGGGPGAGVAAAPPAAPPPRYIK